ncbi:MAG TPA: BON domain-containing protein [Candidatus Polarisedimenticolia bacterium]|nr:BON domain-containing protein [Candidatus Polarisedimenticolia bacterium]
MSPIRSCVVPALLAASLLCVAPSPAMAQKRNIGGPADYYLREKLVGRLSRDPELAGERFTVVLANGGVYLSGTLSSCNLRLRAFSTAAATYGVTNVTDLMVVQRHSLSDDALRVALLDLLGARADEFMLEDLEVTVQDSVATLAGTTPNFYSRVKVEEAAGTVYGVTAIVNRLRPRDLPSGTDDESIAMAVLSYLGDTSNYSFSAEIEVRVEEGVVILSGAGRLYMAQHQAEMMAALVGGVQRVDSKMRVDPGLPMQAPLVKRASR